MSPAAQFALWLEQTHPDIYEVLHAHVVQHRLSGLGDDSGDTTTFDEAGSEPPLQDVGISDVSLSDAISAPNVVTDPGSGTASGILSDLENVGSWLISPAGLTTMANTAGAVLKAQQTAQVAQLQQAVIAQNAAKAAAGQPVVPITYATNTAGQTVPVYDTATMQLMPTELETAIQQGRAHSISLPDGSTGYAIDPQTLQSLFSQLPWYVWLLIAGLFLAAIL